MSMFDRIQKLSKKRGKSVKQVALEIGFGENYFYTLKRQSPKAETLQEIADYFNVSADYLLGRTDEPEIQTIAAHHDGDDWTEEELDEIEQFKEFVRMKRKQQE